MAERPEDLNFPSAVITRVIRESLPSGTHISKETQQAISRAASVFVLYTTSIANSHATDSKRKTVAPQDCYSALDEMEFSRYVPDLKKALVGHKDQQRVKKEQKTQPKAAATPSSAGAELDVINLDSSSAEDDERLDYVVQLLDSDSTSES